MSSIKWKTIDMSSEKMNPMNLYISCHTEKLKKVKLQSLSPKRLREQIVYF